MEGLKGVPVAPLFLILSFIVNINCRVLTPPYINLASGRRITASSTCGEDVPGPEIYCKLVGASHKDNQINLIQGQVCDECNPFNSAQAHPAENAIDGSEKWWQSPPLSRGMKYNEVNLTIDLGQLFQVAYVLITMGNSPRPGIWALERSIDNGETWSPWQYFADNDADCEAFFGKDSVKEIVNDDDVNCITEFSKVVPLEGGEIVVSLLNKRPSRNDFFNSTTLQKFTQATNIRLKLIRTKTLLGHLMSVARQDPTVTRRYFYSIKDISIGGRCVCNGHASVCDIPDRNDPYLLECNCQHNTCGAKCETCCPGFIQKKWRPASKHEAFVCEPCNCLGHSNECIFDENVNEKGLSLDIYGVYEGGGVCQNCRHNTEGINCEKCKFRYFRPWGRALNDTNVCQECDCDYAYSTGNCADGDGKCECRIEFLPPDCLECNVGYYDYPNCKPCDCFQNGTEGGICQVGGGQCPCYENFDGLNCNQCAPGYYNFPECIPCNCSQIGSLDDFCDPVTGQCECSGNFGGRTCERCQHGYFDHPNCEFCGCYTNGTIETICNKTTGDCLCKEGFDRDRCDANAPGWYAYPYVKKCDCHETGSSSSICDATGECHCRRGYSGRACDQCSPSYYNFPECTACDCDSSGTFGLSCDNEGVCNCKPNFDGVKCDRCRESFYNFPICEECNCDPAGVDDSFSGCGNARPGELCECKKRVRGRICNQCMSLFWNLNIYNPDGCEDCACHAPGTIGSLAMCNDISGQCTCKPGVTGRQCDICHDGLYNLQESNLFGCTECDCNPRGSISNNCDKETGKCPCKPRVHGQKCDEPLQTHYFPTLYQHIYEAEDGRTPQGTAVRFGYDENIFPNYSWRGYAVFSELQTETLYDVYITKSSVYRMVMHYRNPNGYQTKGTISITPDNPSDSIQENDVVYPPTDGPELMTVMAIELNAPQYFVMNPGRWTVSIKNDQRIFLDYFVLFPLDYYEGTVLTDNITRVCEMDVYDDVLCVHYAYPDVSNYDFIYGSAGYRSNQDDREALDLFDDKEVLEKLDVQPMALIYDSQDEIQFDIRVNKPGSYVVVLDYYSTTPSYNASVANVIVDISTKNGREKGRAMFYQCRYMWTCRTIVTNVSGDVGTFGIDNNYANVVLKNEMDDEIGIESVVLVPEFDWHADLVRPRPVCIRQNGTCVQSEFLFPPETTKVEFESNTEGKNASIVPAGIADDVVLVYLNGTDQMIDVTGKLTFTGEYIFVVHYYQPKHPEFEMDVFIQNGRFYEGKLNVQHCPSTSGCRAVIRQLNGDQTFSVLENFVLTLKEPGDKDVWLDYLLVIPIKHFSEEALHHLPKDNAARFINECGQNQYFISQNASDFCRESTFALTMEYNRGALPCQCDYYGSESFECNKFGGQCPCKENVIGRQCNKCKTGYFGFPYCRKCDCPSTALCDPESGACICPPRVEGAQCERCAALTFGFDPIIGCEECKCSRLGVKNNNLQCHQLTGQCDCKPNIVDRQCNRCAPGFWSFPHCQLCKCDARGTDPDICNQENAGCYCKPNVINRACDTCIAGTYNLEEANPDGCTQCFCFGKTQGCSSAKLYWDEITKLNDWKTVNLDFSGPTLMRYSVPDLIIEYPSILQLNISSAQEHAGDKVLTTYFSAPNEYLGNKIISYGGYMTYRLVYITDGEGNEPKGGDVVLHGNNITAQYIIPELLKPSEVNDVIVHLTNHNFRTMSGQSISREHFMVMLHNLDGVYIRAQISTQAVEARLKEVTWSIGVPTPTASRQFARSVEQCQCPANYMGTSCEECAPGFYRSPSGPYGGFCIPCECNNHASTCDPVTGKCLDCRHNTVGDHCEKCASGHHGDATRGSPYDCIICVCPHPSRTNNFALSCDVYDGGESIYCHCKEGYTGQRCERCDAGYYGRPDILNEKCEECQCNDNINPKDPQGCDDITGRCINCLNNTYGDSCERCAPWFWGDAVTLKNCESCTCEECGTRECQHYTGICECKANVVGKDCDQCAPDHWGFSSCSGCAACNCAAASVTTQCDGETGNCQCKPGVTGQRCDECKPGYWNYSPEGCQECECRIGFSRGVGCDPVTGKCSCLPGVLGDNCEGCPYRWVLVDGKGCQQCDECTHALLNTTQELDLMILPTIDEFQSAAQSFFLHQKLHLLNESAIELRLFVDNLKFTIGDFESHPITEGLKQLHNVAQIMNNEGGLIFERANTAALDGGLVDSAAKEVLGKLKEGDGQVRKIVSEINKLVIGLETGKGAQIEQAITEAEHILDDMHNRNFTNEKENAEMEMEHAAESMENSKLFYIQIKEQKDMIQNATSHLDTLLHKVNDVKQHIHTSIQNTGNAMTFVDQITEYGVPGLRLKLDESMKIKDGVITAIDTSSKLVDMAGENLKNATINYSAIVGDSADLNYKSSKLNETILNMIDELEENYDLADEAALHSSALEQRANELDEMLTDTRQVSENALMAANAYDNIVKGIEEAQAAAEAAKESAEKAVDLSQGVSENAAMSSNKSEWKFNQAYDKGLLVEEVLLPQLQEAKNNVDLLHATTMDVKDRADMFNGEFAIFEESTLPETTKSQRNIAAEAQEDAEAILKDVDVLIPTLEEDATKARGLRKDVNDAQKALKQGFVQVMTVEDVVPSMIDTSETLLKSRGRIQQKGIDVRERLDKLKQSIKKTRELANKIKVGISFDPSTTIELENPEDLTASATATKISFYMKTNEPDGMLLFLGTPIGGSEQIRRATTDDFIALELDRGYVRLTMTLGADPPHPIENNKVFVADNVWHKITVARTGKVVQLSVHTEDENEGKEIIQSVTRVIPGTFSILNLDPKVSKIFVGGIPPGVSVHDNIISRHYLGQLEDLRVNNRPIGLFNFMTNGTTNIEASSGAYERDRLINLDGPTGLRFDGLGYAAISTHTHRFHDVFSIVLKFKTFGEDGLIYLLADSPDVFISIELSGGRVIFQYNLGSGVARIESEQLYNDGKWHHMEASRQLKQGLLRIGNEVLQGSSSGSQRTMNNIPDTMYFGGYPVEHSIPDVTNDDFNGCIDEVFISTRGIDLSLSRETIGTVPGCKQKVASLVSFEKNSPGFIQLQSPEGVISQLILKFRTNEPNGLIFYAGNVDRNNYLTLSLAEGMLILRSAPGGEINSGEFVRYNDSEWHVVTASLEENHLSLDIDDHERYSVRQIQASSPFDGPLFFGGVPEDYSIDATASAVDTNFYGCIGDVTFNGKVLNLADTDNKPGAILQKCSIDQITSSYQKPKSEIAPGGRITDSPPINVEYVLPTSPPPEPDSSTVETVSQVYTQEPVFTPRPVITEEPEYVETTTEQLITTPREELFSCALPVKPSKPANATEINALSGIRFDDNNSFKFGSKRDARVEHLELPSSMRSDFTFSLDFKTLAEDGIIFYAASENHRDFVSIYIKEGKITFTFNPGTGAAVLKSSRKFNDGQWHKLIANRNLTEGTLHVDGHLEATGESKGGSRYIDYAPPYYYGGVPVNVMKNFNLNTEGVDFSFKGCLRGFRMNSKPIGGQRASYHAEFCSDQVEPGIFFGGGPIRSHAILREKFVVGRSLRMSMDVKPRVQDGVIMSVHGRRDFVMLLLRNGNVEFSVDNGKGIISATYSPTEKFGMCDGNWHRIEIVKNGYVVVLQVDGIQMEPVNGQAGATSADTKNPLFLGTQPHITKRRGNAPKQKFVGCVRNIMLEGKPIDMSVVNYTGNVNAGSCPTI